MMNIFDMMTQQAQNGLANMSHAERIARNMGRGSAPPPTKSFGPPKSGPKPNPFAGRMGDLLAGQGFGGGMPGYQQAQVMPGYQQIGGGMPAPAQNSGMAGQLWGNPMQAAPQQNSGGINPQTGLPWGRHPGMTAQQQQQMVGGQHLGNTLPMGQIPPPSVGSGVAPQQGYQNMRGSMNQRPAQQNYGGMTQGMMKLLGMFGGR